MGDSQGHLTNGLAFCILGLWHLFNHIKLHAINLKSYNSLSWFPTPRIRHLELFFIMAASSISSTMEIFTGSLRHHPWDPDGSISSSHLAHFEHSIVALAFFVYAFFAFLLDNKHTPIAAQHQLTNLLGGVAFAVELLLFHLHSTDHTGLEGQYHWLFQIVIFTSLATTLLSIKYSKSFLIGFVRSLSLLFQGVWLINMGFMLWTPGLIPKGCFMNMEGKQYVVRCHGEKDLDRAKSLANIQFCYYVVGLMAVAMTFYVVMIKLYSEKVEYQSLTKFYENDRDEDDDDDDVEAQKKKKKGIEVGEDKPLLPLEKSFAAMAMEM